MNCGYCTNCGKCVGNYLSYIPNQTPDLYKTASKYNQTAGYSLSFLYSSKPIKFGNGEYA